MADGPQKKRPRVLALVLAGGEGDRLAPLTDKRAKPALPFAGIYRLIDFPLSNCVHSGISDVWVIQQYEPHELARQLAGGRPWDLDRTRGGLRILHPYLGGSESGWYEGNADAIYRNREVIADHDPDVLLVLSADHVYKLDYGDVIADQLESGAAVTMVTTHVPAEEASRYGVVEVDADGIVRGFQYKPDDPAGDLVTTEVFAYDARRLLQTLDDLAGKGESSGLADFGHELLPRLVDEGAARAFQLDGYWRDVGTIEAYWQTHMELLEAEPRLLLDDPAWPVLTAGLQRPPARRCGRTRPRDGGAVGDRPRSRGRGRRGGSGCCAPPRQPRRRTGAGDAGDPRREGARRPGRRRGRRRRDRRAGRASTAAGRLSRVD